MEQFGICPHCLALGLSAATTGFIYLRATGLKANISMLNPKKWKKKNEPQSKDR